jgi:transposase
VNDERIAEMARAYVEEGLSYAKIGERYGISKQRVGQLLGPLEISRDPGQAKIVREQGLRAAHARLMADATTLAEEAELLGFVHGESLRSALHDIGLHYVRPRPIPEHGTIERYRSRKHGCKCAECRRANRERHGQLKGGEPPTHGYSGYVNYECRCKVCKEAHRVALRLRKAEKRRRKEVTI